MTTQNQGLTYLFRIKTKDGSEYHLTSNHEVIFHKKIAYSPYSGLNIDSAIFNDSAENVIMISGLFEDNGITKNHNLVGSVISIMYIKSDSAEDFVTYICTQHNIEDLEFKLKCEPETIKYNQSLLQMFSKTCRANFGDNKCKVNIDHHKLIVNIIEVKANVITCNLESCKDNFFQNGQLIAKQKSDDSLQPGQIKKYRILSHIDNILEIESYDNCQISLKIDQQVILIPSCDKTLFSCHNLFRNTLNFRGEPYIPESHTLYN